MDSQSLKQTSIDSCDTPPSGSAPHRRLITLDWIRFLGAWIGISGTVSATTVCPCCGQQICPNYLGFTALLGFLGGGFYWVLRKTGRSRPKSNNHTPPPDRNLKHGI
jgi:hypothetical protein